MRLEVLGALTVVVLILGVIVAAVAARYHAWGFGVASACLLTGGSVLALAVLQRVRVMTNGPPDPADDQR